MSLDLSSVATQLLSDLGSSDYVKIVRYSGGAFNPVEQEITGGSSSEINCIGIETKITQSLKQDSRVTSSDRAVLIDKAQTPTMKDRIKVGSMVYPIVLIDGFNHAGVQQYWTVVYRG
jgi:hypothetical protein